MKPIHQPGPIERQLLGRIAAAEQSLTGLKKRRGEHLLEGEAAPAAHLRGELDVLTAQVADLREQLAPARRKDEADALEARRSLVNAALAKAGADLVKLAGPKARSLEKARDAFAVELQTYIDSMTAADSTVIRALLAVNDRSIQLHAGGMFSPARTSRAIVEGLLANLLGLFDLRDVRPTGYAPDVEGMTQQTAERFLASAADDADRLLAPVPAAAEGAEEQVPGQGPRGRSGRALRDPACFPVEEAQP